MAYGKIKADAIIYDNSGSDVEVSTADITGKAGLASPTFTGTPAAPTASSGTNTTQIATTAFVATGLGTKLPLAGGTLTGNVDFNDNVKARFGTGDDLQIYHDGTNNWFWAQNGPTIHESSSSWTVRSVANENYIVATENGAVELYYDGSKKLDTKSYGIDVTGAIVATGAVTADSYKTPAQAVSALDINLSTGNYFKKSISTSSTVTFSNPPASGTVGSFTLELVLTGTGTAITWPAGTGGQGTVYWNADAGQTAPTLTDARTHLFMFVTTDGGTKYRGAVLSNYTG